ncbi:transmembrane protein 272-like [Pecten maximus]|uniref:transmembrane protein 272-like n=1 Tax=Pecten maximus TaxID=6579 RepID=UPI0014585C72|nr:transmembrane protein 272-like [Pecten maximus]
MSFLSSIGSRTRAVRSVYLNSGRKGQHIRGTKELLLPEKYEDERSLCRSSSYMSDASQFDTGSYGTLFSQIQEVSTDSEGPLEFVARVVRVLWSSLVATVILVLLLVFSVTMIGVGSAYRRDCPKEPKIPIYLLVGGCFGIVKIIMMIWNKNRKKNYERFGLEPEDDMDDDAVMLRSTKFTGFILNMFLLTWFVIGNVWFYQIWTPNYEQPLHEPKNWCHEMLYTYTFYQILICYSLIGCYVFFIFACLAYYWCWCPRRQQDKS